MLVARKVRAPVDEDLRVSETGSRSIVPLEGKPDNCVSESFAVSAPQGHLGVRVQRFQHLCSTRVIRNLKLDEKQMRRELNRALLRHVRSAALLVTTSSNILECNMRRKHSR